MRISGLVGVFLLVIGGSQPAGAQLPEVFGPVHGKVIWVDFWASWCAPCRRSFPWMNTMYRKYAAEGLEIIAVNVDKDRKLAEDFLAETPAEFRLHFDPSGGLAADFGVQAMPSSFVLDADGNVLAKHYGFKLADIEEYEQAIRAALASVPERVDEPEESR
jgi:thiol-disulfide isomerase/thioredoxin